MTRHSKAATQHLAVKSCFFFFFFLTRVGVRSMNIERRCAPYLSDSSAAWICSAYVCVCMRLMTTRVNIAVVMMMMSSRKSTHCWRIVLHINAHARVYTHTHTLTSLQNCFHHIFMCRQQIKGPPASWGQLLSFSHLTQFLFLSAAENNKAPQIKVIENNWPVASQLQSTYPRQTNTLVAKPKNKNEF